ncbi:hypothetical protein ACQ5SO_07560 [Rhodovulum sp. DZ06]|uniref:hypothetical protein n=1 Tax=Rhodovulum sp. DZ06 TaxID=3425126 RepID=UPI003D346228
MLPSLRAVFIPALALAAAGIGVGAAAAQERAFIALGPLPGPAVEAGRTVLQVNAAAPGLVLQLGLAGPGAECGPGALRARASYLSGFDAPVLATAGKGDRMACAMATGEPGRGLDAHRAVIHDAPALTHGRRRGLAWTEAAEGRPENRAMILGGVLYVAASDGDVLAAADWIEDTAARAVGAGATAVVVGLPSDPAARGMARAAGALRAAAAMVDGRLLALHPGDAPLARGAGGVMAMGAPRDAEGAPLAIGLDLAAPFPCLVPDRAQSARLAPVPGASAERGRRPPPGRAPGRGGGAPLTPLARAPRPGPARGSSASAPGPPPGPPPGPAFTGRAASRLRPRRALPRARFPCFTRG